MARPDQIMALYRSHFPAFARFAFRELNPAERLNDNGYLMILLDALDRVVQGKTTRLIVNMPPKTLKSLSASVALPTWLLGRDPTRTILSVTGTKEAAAKFDAATRALMATPRCRSLFPHLQPLAKSDDLRLVQGGGRIAAIAGRPLLGRTADLIIVDDPITPALVHDDAKRKALNVWFNAEVLQRLKDQNRGAVIVLMHRLHHDDLCGHLIAGEQPWTHVKVPALSTEDERWPRLVGGDLVRPKRQYMKSHHGDHVDLYRRLIEMGAYNFSAAYQQAPYRHMNEREVRGGCFDGGDDEYGFPTIWYGTVPEREILAFEVFGYGDRHPAAPARRLTEDEFEKLGRWTADYQRRLREDPDAEWGPPENDAGSEDSGLLQKTAASETEPKKD